MRPIYFEDMKLNEKDRSREYNLSQKEIIEFARQWDPLPHHTDPNIGKKSQFGGLIASGFHLLCICEKLTIETRADIDFVGLGMTDIRFSAVARPDDILILEIETISKRDSRSNPHAGIVDQIFSLVNQHGQTVLTYTGIGLVEKSPQKG